jgi:lysophospholipase L1-like esterase
MKTIFAGHISPVSAEAYHCSEPNSRTRVPPIRIGSWQARCQSCFRIPGFLILLIAFLNPGFTGCAQPVGTNAPAALPASMVTVPAPDLATNPPSRLPPINSRLPSIFIAGDSTAARGSGDAQQGWAVPFANYFDPKKVNVINRARGGRSSRTFITEGLWDQLLSNVKPGDLVLIQFGHNDGGAINDNSRARGSIPGVGEETEEIDNLITKKHEIVHTYGWYLRKMIAETQAKGATPIVLSLTVRDVWNDGRAERGSGRYGQWSSEVARTASVPFIDLSGAMANQFDALGEEKVKAFYPKDHTHFNAAGADLHAAAVVAGLKGLRSNPVRDFLSAKGEAVEAAPNGANGK